ncbi:MAG: PCI domain-containing protein [Candidatus Helarchaeota archaeon]
MIEIEDIWHNDVKKISDTINKLHQIHDFSGVIKEISKLIDFFKKEIPKKQKEEKKLYFKQWSSYQALLKIIKNNPKYLFEFKQDLVWLSRSQNQTIYERARELINKLNWKPEHEKCLYLTINDFNKIIKNKDEISINDIAEILEINFEEALDWVKQLIKEKQINAYIANNIVHII